MSTEFCASHTNPENELRVLGSNSASPCPSHFAPGTTRGSPRSHGKCSQEVRRQQFGETYVVLFLQIVKQHPSIPGKQKRTVSVVRVRLNGDAFCCLEPRPGMLFNLWSKTRGKCSTRRDELLIRLGLAGIFRIPISQKSLWACQKSRNALAPQSSCIPDAFYYFAFDQDSIYVDATFKLCVFLG